MSEFWTKDGSKLVYDDNAGPVNAPVLLFLHGWSGSRRYFSRIVPLLRHVCRVICLDMRFHGDSSSPAHGMHIARLAADVNEFIVGLGLRKLTLVGTSMGCAVIWSYFELFGCGSLDHAVFVDQLPLQNRRNDWNLYGYGCYDEASLAGIEKTLKTDLKAVAAGNLSSCLVRTDVPKEILDVLYSDVLKCKPEALATLMRDHTQLDWRPLLPLISIPCLNVIGGPNNKVFPMEGALTVGKMIPKCINVVFEDCGHWLYIERPQTFSNILLAFIQRQILPAASNIVIKN
ncbi:alpha/beta-hydrolase [Thraustotheca clavata]|uniref:Alpha/beta-hydrolase n=1 Tax=Thraustotheca clavata TaxID=74557 RepID=A0A1V9YU95_9STRA|nr:alpha/beta-hydrolase [Thraustotheca clavata]